MKAKMIHRCIHVLDLDASLAFYERALGLVAVSYTHLDVYKRQGQTRAGKPDRSRMPQRRRRAQS